MKTLKAVLCTRICIHRIDNNQFTTTILVGTVGYRYYYKMHNKLNHPAESKTFFEFFRKNSI